MVIVYSLTGVLCLFFIIGIKGSVILIESSPDTVKDGLTHTVSLRCSINDTAVSSGIIGRRDLDNYNLGNHDDILDGDSKQIGIVEVSYNVDEVLSIIVTSNGVDVAAITHTHPARVLDGSSNLQVSGKVETSKGQGYITLTWEYPTSGQLHNIQCQASAISQVGHPVMFSQDTNFEVSTPTIMDLVSHINNNEKTNKLANDRIGNLETNISEIQVEKQMMRTAISNLETENIALKATIERVSHIETGTVHVSHGVHLSGTGERFTDVKEQFKKPYDKAPNVTFGTKRLDALAGGIRYDARLQQVDTHGFTVRLGTWAGTHIVSWDLDWVSFPSL